MVAVNLLPWRQQRLQRQQRIWGRLMLSLGMLLLPGILQGYCQRELNRQQYALNAGWELALQQFREVQRQRLIYEERLGRVQAQWQQRQRYQQQMVLWREFSDLLAARIPAAVWLLSLKQAADELELHGISQDIGQLQRFSDTLGQAPAVQQVLAGNLERDKQDALRFTLRLRLAGQENSP